MARMGRRRTTDLHLPPRMRRKGSAYYFDTAEKPRKWVALGSDFPAALRKWADLCGKAPDSSPTFSDAVERYKKIAYRDKAPRTRKDNDSEFKMLEAVFGRSPIDSITKSDVEQYHAKRGLQAPIRANRELALLSSLWTFAQSAHSGRLTDKPNPCVGVKRFKEHVRTNFVTDDVFLSIVYEAPPMVADAMWLALLTGQRVSDVLGLRRDRIRDLALEVRQGKTGKPLRLELAGMTLGKLVDELLARPRAVSGPWLIQDEAGQRLDYFRFAKAFASARKTAAGNATGELADEIRRCQFRDLRAKSGTEKAEQEGILAARDLLGHESVTTTERYVRARRGAKVRPLK